MTKQATNNGTVEGMMQSLCETGEALDKTAEIATKFMKEAQDRVIGILDTVRDSAHYVEISRNIGAYAHIPVEKIAKDFKRGLNKVLVRRDFTLMAPIFKGMGFEQINGRYTNGDTIIGCDTWHHDFTVISITSLGEKELEEVTKLVKVYQFTEKDMTPEDHFMCATWPEAITELLPTVDQYKYSESVVISSATLRRLTASTRNEYVNDHVYSKIAPGISLISRPHNVDFTGEGDYSVVLQWSDLATNEHIEEALKKVKAARKDHRRFTQHPRFWIFMLAAGLFGAAIRGYFNL